MVSLSVRARDLLVRYMDIENQYGVMEMQEHLLVLMHEFHSFCVKNEIKYSMDWGSLLGAVRHKGFIPWDDDLDIMVDRDNYNRIVEVIDKDGRFQFDNTNPQTLWIKRIRSVNGTEKYVYPPTIDIIIVDNAPNGKIARKLRILFTLMFQGMLKVYPDFKKGNILIRLCSRITYYLGRVFPRDLKLYWYDKMARMSNGKSVRQLTSYFEEFNCLGKYYPTSLLKELILVPFENIEVYIVKNYHECLTIQFGSDYMTPKRDRLNHNEKRTKILQDHA